MELNTFIDHTLLKRDVLKKEMDKAVEETIKYHFKTLCIAPSWITYVKKPLKKKGIGITTVISFPYGQNTTETKVKEAKDAIKKGADELDFIANISRVHDRDTKYLKKELKKIRKATKDKTIKLIIETGLLDDEEKKYISKLGADAGFDFIKTSTGVGTTGATVADVKLIRSVIGNSVQIKASGGVRTYKDAVSLIEAGANRIGTSNGVALVEKTTGKSDY